MSAGKSGRLPGKLLVIGDSGVANRPLPTVASELAAAGCPWFMIREKALSAPELLVLVKETRSSTATSAMRLSLNASQDLLADSGLSALHLASNLDPARARSKLGSDCLIGQSVHNAAEIARAIDAGIDYLLLSPFLNPNSKNDSRTPIGPEGFRRFVEMSPVPVVALGGINADNAQKALDAGADAVAVLGSVMASDQPGRAVEALLRRVGS